MLRHTLRALYCGIVFCALLIGTAGCGGGGGGPASPVSSEVQADTGVNSAVDIDSASTGTRSVNLNNYNNWWGPVKGASDYADKVQSLAKKERICMTEKYSLLAGLTANDLRAKNPSAKIYRIYDLLCKNRWDVDWGNFHKVQSMQTPLTKAEIDRNNWWLRDGNGEIIAVDDDTWIIDIGKPGIKEAYLSTVLDRLEGSGVDGVVFDYWSPEISKWMHGRPRPADYPNDNAWFAKACQPFLAYVIDGLHAAGYEVIVNCGGAYGMTGAEPVWLRNRIDGTVYEQWVVGWKGEWLPGSTIEKRILAFKNDPLEAWSADYGLVSSDPMYAQKAQLGLAMYYIALPDSPAMRSNRSYHHRNARLVFWDPLWDFSIGEPAASAVKMGNRYFWSRKFTAGLVLMNYESSESISYPLDRTYKLPDGTLVSGQVTVEPHSALILATTGN
ncbi:MAG: putative glycoside hydrolase [Armatimonadota bacterium]